MKRTALVVDILLVITLFAIVAMVYPRAKQRIVMGTKTEQNVRVEKANRVLASISQKEKVPYYTLTAINTDNREMSLSFTTSNGMTTMGFRADIITKMYGKTRDWQVGDRIKFKRKTDAEMTIWRYIRRPRGPGRDIREENLLGIHLVK